MTQNNELINILKAELTLLSKDILANIHQKDIKDLYKSTRQLYEKMAAIMLLKDNLSVEKLQKLITEEPVSEPVQKAPTADNKQEDKPKVKPVAADNPYKSVPKMNFVPKEQLSDNAKNDPVKPSKISAKPVKKMSIGLNDRIAFIKHLFKGNADAYTQFIDTLNAFDTYEEALQFIHNDIKPQYDNWDGLDEYEFRLLQLLELKFA